MKNRSEKSVRSTNRNWALFDLAGISSRIMRMQSQGVISIQEGTEMLTHIERIKCTVKAYKP